MRRWRAAAPAAAVSSARCWFVVARTAAARVCLHASAQEYCLACNPEEAVCIAVDWIQRTTGTAPPRAALSLSLSPSHARADGDKPWSVVDLQALLEPLHALPTAALARCQRLGELHAVSCAVGLLLAAQHGHVAIFEGLLARATKGASACARCWRRVAHGARAAAPRRLLEAAAGSAAYAAASSGSARLASRIRSAVTLPPAALRSIDTLLARQSGAGPVRGPAPLVVMGGVLPASLATGERHRSALTDTIVRGALHRLSDDTVISRSEALMWASACGLSPVCDGSKCEVWAN